MKYTRWAFKNIKSKSLFTIGDADKWNTDKHHCKEPIIWSTRKEAREYKNCFNLDEYKIIKIIVSLKEAV